MAVTPKLLNVKQDIDARLENVQITGTLEVDGATTLTGAIAASGGVSIPVQVASADGAITLRNGVVAITKGSAAALTLAAPTVDGLVLYIDAHTAHAHTVTVAGGLRGAGAGADVGTFGGAIGDGIVLYSYNGAWYPVPGTNTNVTFA